MESQAMFSLWIRAPYSNWELRGFFDSLDEAQKFFVEAEAHQEGTLFRIIEEKVVDFGTYQK